MGGATAEGAALNLLPLLGRNTANALCTHTTSWPSAAMRMACCNAVMLLISSRCRVVFAVPMVPKLNGCCGPVS